eukprot:scaffold8552_cov59-Phaeocystis_antarctica.AAC.1
MPPPAAAGLAQPSPPKPPTKGGESPTPPPPPQPPLPPVMPPPSPPEAPRMVVAETTANIVLGDATLTDATETAKIIDALTLQYNTTSVKDAGAEVPHAPPPLATLPHPSHRTQPWSPSLGERHPLPRVRRHDDVGDRSTRAAALYRTHACPHARCFQPQLCGHHRRRRRRR